jgi:hypothetical protein
MAKGAIIYTDGTYELKEFKQLDDYKSAVGGWIEHLGMYSTKSGLNGSAYVNEEGLLLNLKPNRYASIVAWLASAIYNDDCIFGNMVVLGRADDEGNDTDIAPMWLDIVAHNCTERTNNANNL